MAQENNAELFIRLLKETLEADRTIRNRHLNTQSKINAQIYSTAFAKVTHSAEPADCFEEMLSNRAFSQAR